MSESEKHGAGYLSRWKISLSDNASCWPMALDFGTPDSSSNKMTNRQYRPAVLRRELQDRGHSALDSEHVISSESIVLKERLRCETGDTDFGAMPEIKKFSENASREALPVYTVDWTQLPRSSASNDL